MSSSSASLNGSDDVPVDCADNGGSDVCLLSDDRSLDNRLLDDHLLDDDKEQAAIGSVEDHDEPCQESNNRWSCLNRTGVVVVTAAVVGVFVVIGVIVVVILSVLSLNNSAKVEHHGVVDASVKVTGVPLSTMVQQSRSVIVELTLHDNCTTRVAGSIEDGVRSFKVCVFTLMLSFYGFRTSHDAFLLLMDL